MIGSQVGHYQILEKLGEGGMGMVYKARDLLLNRVAALKFLPADSAASEDKRRRFLQEAQAASALNHPNIVTIYEVGQAEGRDFIAMELVPGQPLNELIARKPLPLATALDYAVQISSALAAAHAAGIVHRDLKPANVMIAESGIAKVLDFGLAKLVAPVAAPSDATRTILADNPKTVDGAILGTLSYMSPEQAEGKTVDHRSDIFSFGIVVYEMLTGHRAFEGESAASTIAAILTAEPAPISADAPGIPAELSRVVSRCLRKQPARRWQSIADVQLALEDLKQDLEAGRLGQAAAPVAAAPARKSWVPIAAAVLATAALTAFAVWRAVPAAAPAVYWRIRRLTSDSGATFYSAISNDGKVVAYASDRATGASTDLWVQQVEGGDPVQLTRDLPGCTMPDFSPDGSRIAVQCGSEPDAQVYLVSTFGGLPKKLADGLMPKFSPDGSKVSYIAPATGSADRYSLWIIPSAGGTAKEIPTDKSIYGAPIWRPDGKGLLFIGVVNQPGSGHDWYFAPVDGGPVVPTGAVKHLDAASLGLGKGLSVMPGGLLFWDGDLDSTSFYRMPFDARFEKVSGDAVPLIVGAGYNFWPSSSQDGRRIAFSVGTNLSSNIWRAPVDAAMGKVSGDAVRITSGLGRSRVPSPARDARRLAYLASTGAGWEIRFRELDGGKDVRLAEAKDWSYVVLSPDGSTLAYNSDERRHSGIYAVSPAGGLPRKLCPSCGRPIEWSPDRSRLFIDNAGTSGRDIEILDVASGQHTPLLQHPENQLTVPRLSPDGHLLAFTEVRPGRARRIYLAPFTGSAVPQKDWTVLVDSSTLDRQPVWAPSGNILYFLSERDGSRCVWGQRVDLATRQPQGPPFALYHMHQIRYNLMDVGDPASVGLSFAGGQMFYTSFELQSNIWLAERRPTASR